MVPSPRLPHVGAMQIRFLHDVPAERGVFRAGRIVTVQKLPKGWDQWLQAGLIQIHRTDETETAEALPLPEVAATVRHGGQERPSSALRPGRASRRRMSRSAKVAPESSRSMTRTDWRRGPTCSMRATRPGG